MRRAWVHGVIVGAALCVAACGGGRGEPAAADGGVLEFDAAMLRSGGDRDAAGDDGATPVTCPDARPATVDSEGVLSAYPDISYFVAPGFRLESVGFAITEDGDSRGPLLEMFAEVVNTGIDTECSFLPDVYLDFEEIVTLVESPPYYSESVDTVTTACISPGETGVATGVQRGITWSDLETATSLEIDMSPGTYSTYWPATDGPAITREEVVEADGGWALSGELYVGTTVRNYGLTVYPRDGRGLLIDELLAFPGELETLPAGTSIEFQTDEAPCRFEERLAYPSWIREDPGALTWLPEPWVERDEARRARRARMAGLRATR